MGSKLTSIQALSTSEVRKRNRNLVYNYIFNVEGGKTYKQDIASQLGLSLPTVSQNIAELFDKNLIEYDGTFESTGGRKAKVIIAKTSAKYSIGVDITRDHVGIVIINLKGEIIESKRYNLIFFDTSSYFLKISKFIDNMIITKKYYLDSILGVGIAVPAIVSDDGTEITYAAFLDYTSGKLSQFSNNLHLNCKIFNDANAGCFAELWSINILRKPMWQKNLVFLSINSSVGGSFMTNSSVMYGNNQRFGEFGHMSLIPNGKKCYCGKLGCVDSYLASHLLSDITGGSLQLFFEKLAKGDSKISKIWDEYIYYLSITLNNLRMVFDCDIVIGGYIGNFISPYIPQIQNLVSNLNTFETDGSYIKCCYYRHESTAVGAALMLVDSFIQTI